MSEWHYSQNGQQFGPVTSTQLKELAAAGQIGGNDLVWREGMKEWTPASSVNGLFAPGIEAGQRVPVEGGDPHVAQPAAAIPYYNPTAGLGSRVRQSLMGFPTPTGRQDEWPLSTTHLMQLKETEKLRKDIRTCASLYNVLAFLYAIIGGIMLIFGLFEMGSRSSSSAAFEAGFMLGVVAILGGFTTLAIFAKRATLRCRKWAPITFIVLFSLGLILNLMSVAISSGSRSSDGANMVGVLVSVLFTGAFIYISIRGLVAMPKFLASPVWAQEALVNAKL